MRFFGQYRQSAPLLQRPTVLRNLHNFHLQRDRHLRWFSLIKRHLCGTPTVLDGLSHYPYGLATAHHISHLLRDGQFFCDYAAMV
jgi:hypothetical protein